MTDTTDKHDSLPDEYVAALRKADRAPAVIASRVDRAVAAAATTQFSARTEGRRHRQGWYAAAASVLALAVVLQLQLTQQPDDLLYTDVDGSGQIDIADVMALALDVDQSYTKAELDAFARSVVSVGGTP